jgi:hypothetical protein
MVAEWCIGNDLEGNTRDLIGAILAYAWTDWGKPQQILVRMADVPTMIQTELTSELRGVESFLRSH